MAKKRKLFAWIKTSAWTFPLALLIFFSVLVLFKIHGSSIGVYHWTLYGREVQDPDLVYGSPKPIRSDEWLGGTQLTIMQDQSDYPEYNQHLVSGGNDVSKVFDAPTKDWVTFFRPYNIPFLALPFDFAFAIKWWSMLFLLIVSSYFFILRVTKSKLFSILLAISFGISPFVLWWYQAALFLPLAYGFLLLILGMRVIDQEKIPFVRSKLKINILYTLALSYIGVSGGLLLYPPFLIPIIFTIVLFLVGYMAQRLTQNKISLRELLKRLSVFGMASLISIVFGFIFFTEHKDMIDSVANSLYPGQRISTSGDLGYLSIFDGFLMPLLQSEIRGANFFVNQSEASNFILILPFLLLPGIILQVIEYRRTKKIDYVFAAINAVAIIFFLKAFVHFGDGIYKILLLDRVPGIRLIIGFGFVGILQMVYFAKKIGEIKFEFRNLAITSLLYSAVIFGILFIIGQDVMHDYPKFVSNTTLITGFAGLFTSIITLFMLNKKILAAIVLLVFSVGSSFKILPLYKGTEVLRENNVVNKIEQVSQPEDNWVTMGNIFFENFPLMSGRDLVGGLQLYPDLDFWSQVAGSSYEGAYNRQGHMVFTTDPTVTEPIKNTASNYIVIKFECTDFVRKNVDYVLTTKQIDFPCAQYVDRVNYPRVEFFIYRIQP